jgi:hypothetical protein
VDAWPFADPPNTAAITTRPVLEQSAPILLVVHDADDGARQFLCGTTNDSADGAWRARPGAPWQRPPA